MTKKKLKQIEDDVWRILTTCFEGPECMIYLAISNIMDSIKRINNE